MARQPRGGYNMTDISYLIHSPTEIFTNGQRYLERRRDGNTYGIPLGLSSIDKSNDPKFPDEQFLPVWPGEMITVIGRPGHGKTGLMMWWARSWAKELQRRNEINRCVLYVTYEQTIEELNAFNLAAETNVSITRLAMGQSTDDEWMKIKQAGARRAQLPLWFMGHSFERRNGQKRPPMNAANITEAILSVQNWGGDRREVDMVFVDYLQRMPIDGHAESKTVAHSGQLDDLKDTAMELGTRMIVGVQAKREVDAKSLPIPSQEDGQWTSNIEQASDGVLTVCRPRKYKQEGESFGPSGMLVQGDTQMIITVAKRKLGPDNFARWVRFDPRYNQLDNLELLHVDFNDRD
jgi:replicative DNA helicase